MRWRRVSVLGSIGLAAAIGLGGCKEDAPTGNGDGDADASPPNANAALTSLLVSEGELEPPFDPEVTEYSLALPLGAEDLVVTATAEVPDGVSIEISGAAVESGVPSPGVALDLGDNLIEVVVLPEEGEPRIYAIAASRGAGILQQAYIKASNTGLADQFGQSVALDGDTLVVGARFEDSAATGVGGGTSEQADDSEPAAGAVYIFTRSSTGWSQQAYVKASNTDAEDFFGFSVALSVDTLAVGAPLEDSAATGTGGGAAEQADNSADSAGAVYVFSRSGTIWSQQAYIKASNTDAGDRFGGSVALDGDTLVVGAHFEDSAATGVGGGTSEQADNTALGAGAAYVFFRSGTTWSQQAYLKASNTGAVDGFDDRFGDNFGGSVTLSGDTLAVGAVREASSATGAGGGATEQSDNSAEGAGAVYVFTRSGTTWSQQAYIKASNTDAEDRFGVSLGLDGDTLAVGAGSEASAATGSDGGEADQADNTVVTAGAVYVFTRSGSSWSQQAYIKASNTGSPDVFGSGDFFGSSLALVGDTLAVGAFGEDSAATGTGGGADEQADNSARDAGAVYVFTRSDTRWSQQTYLKASNSGSGDRFGESVALDGDTLAVGAFGESSTATGVGGGEIEQSNNNSSLSGAVYVF